MAKWADYCITAVRFNEKHTHIDQVKRRVDNGESLGDTSIVSRQTVIADLKRGTSYITVFKGADDKWSKGQNVFIVTLNGTEYIKTVEDKITKDNLDDLPEF
jgi:hypothetical protein